MIAAAFAVPGDIKLATGGYAYARAILARMPDCQIRLQHVPLEGSFPHPTRSHLDDCAQALQALTPALPTIVDGLAFGTFPSAVMERINHLRLIALVHHPLSLERGLSRQRRDELFRTERDALAQAAAVITTSDYTARELVDDFGVGATKITVAEPGTSPAARAIGTGAPVQILSVGSLVPRKGYPVLINALAPLRALAWHLTIVGAPRDQQEAAKIEALIGRHGLTAKITLAGEVSLADLNALYQRADLFVMASHHEGYGMVLGEAMARGLAIVTTRAGAASETVPDQVAIKVMPGDADALTGAISTMLVDEPQRRALADASWTCGQALPDWQETAARIGEVIRAVNQEMVL